MTTGPVLVPILGDQLSAALPSLADRTPADTVVLMMEVAEETTYVRHHKQKIAFILSAMRHHAAALTEAGWQVDYVRLDDADNSGSITGELARALDDGAYETVVMTECGEWRLAEHLAAFAEGAGLPVEIREDRRFISSHDRFRRWASGKSQLRMEFFYREMRRATGILMDSDQPEGGRWNYDAENRKKLAKGVTPPDRLRIPPNAVAREAMADVERAKQHRLCVLFRRHAGHRTKRSYEQAGGYRVVAKTTSGRIGERPFEQHTQRI